METIETLTPSQAAAAGGVAGAMIGTTAVLVLIFYIISVIATWKIFQKAGEPGWKCLIPIYNIYIMYKIVGMKGWFWFMLCIGILFGVVTALDGTSYIIFNGTSEQVALFDWGQHIPTVIMLFVTLVVGIWGTILYDWRTSRAFGHGFGYFIGLFFLQPIFWLIIGFGKSKYHKKIAMRKAV